MYRKRIFPIMLVADGRVVKTEKFGSPKYVGDPVNIASIYSEFEVDELFVLDIHATKKNQFIDFRLLRRIANVARMPLSYGGGIKKVDDASRIFDLGFEKISISNSLFYDLGIVENIANVYGSQSICGVIDFYSRNKKFEIYRYDSERVYHTDFNSRFLKRIQNHGVGELMFNSVNTEGTWSNFPIEVSTRILEEIDLPVIAHGGITNFQSAQIVLDHGFQAVGISSSYIFQKKYHGVVLHKFT